MIAIGIVEEWIKTRAQVPYGYWTSAYCGASSLVSGCCDSCSSGQGFAYNFLRIPRHQGHPCCSATRFPPPDVLGTFTRSPMPGAHRKTGGQLQKLLSADSGIITNWFQLCGKNARGIQRLSACPTGVSYAVQSACADIRCRRRASMRLFCASEHSPGASRRKSLGNRAASP